LGEAGSGEIQTRFLRAIADAIENRPKKSKK
ncbi:hypothetical protein LCGC14_2672420, partial [marine sediment metagenome]